MSRTNETLFRNEVLIPMTNLFGFVFVFVFVLAHEQAISKYHPVERPDVTSSKSFSQLIFAYNNLYEPYINMLKFSWYQLGENFCMVKF